MSGPAEVGVLGAGVDGLPHEIAILDADGTVLAVNEAWRRFADRNHGYHPDYWVGENYLRACRRGEDPPGTADDLVAALEAVLAGDRDHYRQEYPCHSPDEQRWFRLDALRFSHDGRPHVLVVHTDVTDQKLAELRAQARTRQLETVLEVLQHDLRNPLNVIEGYTELLAAELDDDDAVETIRQAAARIGEITEATLSFSEAGALSELEPLSVADVAGTAWRTVPTGDARLTVAGDRRLIGDRRLLLQLFENLFRNALDHAGPDVWVRVGPLPEGFYVEDDGPGIPPAVREKAVRADYSTRGSGGLGLSIVQAVVGAHGGELTIGEAADGGARFELTGFDAPPDPVADGPAPSERRER